MDVNSEAAPSAPISPQRPPTAMISTSSNSRSLAPLHAPAADVNGLNKRPRLESLHPAQNRLPPPSGLYSHGNNGLPQSFAFGMPHPVQASYSPGFMPGMFANTPPHPNPGVFTGSQGFYPPLGQQQIAQNGFNTAQVPDRRSTQSTQTRPEQSSLATQSIVPGRPLSQETFQSNLARGYHPGMAINSSWSTHRVPTPSISATSTKKRSFVDLTEDDDDVQVVAVKSAPPGTVLVQQQPVLDVRVCYGLIKGTVNAHHCPHLGSNQKQTHSEFWPTIPITITRSTAPDSLACCVSDPKKVIFGCVTVQTARFLAPLMGLPSVETSAYMYPRARKPNEEPGMELDSTEKTTMSFIAHICGPEKLIPIIAKLAREKQGKFEDPLPPNKLPYRNPCDYALKNGLFSDVRRLADYTPVRSPIARHNVNAVVTSGAALNEYANGMFDDMDSAAYSEKMEQDPRVLTPLLDHQKEGLHFLYNHEQHRFRDDKEELYGTLWEKSGSDYAHVVTSETTSAKPQECLGGILADMMGLGKTLQIISLILASQKESIEYSKKRYLGRQRTPAMEAAAPTRYCKATLLICPLTLIQNWKDQVEQHVEADALSVYVYHGDRRMRDLDKLSEYDIIITTYQIVGNEYGKHLQNKTSFAGPLQHLNFFRVVLDEAHMIRTPTTRLSKAVLALQAERRWAVTGTPIQNKLEDLRTLFRFIRLRPFDDKPVFKQYIEQPFDPSNKGYIKNLRTIVNSVTIRRLKDKIGLPTMKEETVQLEFSPVDRAIYDQMEHKYSNRLKALVQKSRKSFSWKDYLNILAMILQLRQMCAHNRELSGEVDPEFLEGQSADNSIDLEKGDDRPPFSASEAYNILYLMKGANEDQCRSCSVNAVYKEVKDDPNVLELEEGEGKKYANTIGFLTMCSHFLCVSCKEQYQSKISHFEPGLKCVCPICGVNRLMDLIELKRDEMLENEIAASKTVKKSFEYRGPSTKVLALLNSLQENRNASKPGDVIKSVVFSYWTSHLDLIERAFVQHDVKFTRLDGGMSLAKRSQAITQFNKDDEIEVFLITIGAGGLGLNLTAASRVYLMEPQWNPSCEAQAVDRIHRLGQIREVVATRYIMKNSFEGKIQALQEKKKLMSATALASRPGGKTGKGKNTTRFTDINYLFGGQD